MAAASIGGTGYHASLAALRRRDRNPRPVWIAETSIVATARTEPVGSGVAAAIAAGGVGVALVRREAQVPAGSEYRAINCSCRRTPPSQPNGQPPSRAERGISLR